MNKRGLTLLQILATLLLVGVLAGLLAPILIGASGVPVTAREMQTFKAKAEQDIVPSNFNPFVKSWGGKMTVTLPKKYKLIMPTWKDSELWLFLLDTTTNELVYREVSSFGVLQGEVIFKTGE